MSDYYPYMEQHARRAEEWAAQAAEDRLASELVRTRRAEARAARHRTTQGLARLLRLPAVRRLRSL